MSENIKSPEYGVAERREDLEHWVDYTMWGSYDDNYPLDFEDEFTFCGDYNNVEQNTKLVEKFSGYRRDQSEFELVYKLIQSILLSKLFSTEHNSVSNDSNTYLGWRRMLWVVVELKNSSEGERRKLIEYAEELRGNEIEPQSRFGRDNEEIIKDKLDKYLYPLITDLSLY